MRIALRIALAASAALLTLGVAQAQEKTLRIGTEGAYPPFNNLTADGQLVGFDVDIAKALCDEMKVKCTFVAQDWDGIIPALQAKKFDAIIASMSITEERKKQVAFTHKYYTTPLALVAPKDSELTSTEPAALAGKTVGAQASTTQADFAQDVYGKAGAEAKLYP
ncbi:MAG: transporter substrate-binding domain-containing protein, partial [Mesorhizobium sp.]